jgi:hypothetical protein
VTGNGHHDQARDVAFERAFTATASVAVGRAPAAITAMSEARAPLEPIRGFLVRDLCQDGLEEFADGRNYICWQALHVDHVGRRDPLAREARKALGRALGAAVMGFEELRLAQALLAAEVRAA